MDRKAMYKMINSKKAVMIGCGFVGSASVFALMQSGLFDIYRIRNYKHDTCKISLCYFRND